MLTYSCGPENLVFWFFFLGGGGGGDGIYMVFSEEAYQFSLTGVLRETIEN